MNEQLIKQALKANNLSLGVHWIYDREYLKELSKKEHLLGLVPNKKHYDAAKISYFAYTEKDQYSIQGHILKWLFEAVIKNEDFNELDYKELLLEKLMPGGKYKGYVESYGKKLVYNELAKAFTKPELVLDDDQMVGFIPYLIFKWQNSNDSTTDYMKKALNFVKVLSNNEDYYNYFLMFDYIIENTKINDYKKTLQDAIKFAPKDREKSLSKALTATNVEEFITSYSGTACGIYDAVSLIYFILANTNNYKEALELNVKLGGAAADRAILLSYLLTFITINNEEPQE